MYVWQGANKYSTNLGLLNCWPALIVGQLLWSAYDPHIKPKNNDFERTERHKKYIKQISIMSCDIHNDHNNSK